METTINGHTLTARRNTRHGSEVPEHEFTTVGVHLCTYGGSNRHRRLWVMDGGENGRAYVRLGSAEFDALEAPLAEVVR